MDDEAILDLFFVRNEQAIHETEQKYGKYCMNIAQNILGSYEDAEECVNDTWLRTWNSIPPQRPNVFRLWLGKVTRNLSLDRYRRNRARKRNRETELSLEELENCISLPEEKASLLPRLMNEFLDTLDERDQQLFVGRYWYGYKLEQLSRGYGIPISTVKYRIDRVRDALRIFLEKEGYPI